ncbi:MAG: hypothetical protein HUJ69_01430 [Lachnospiraceae bacterium]|nr:hypothetical protein [Lachnospiraceae bacterium]
MIDSGVYPGDYVIVRKQNTAEVGEIIAALYDNGLNNLKKLCFDENRKLLHYEQSAKEAAVEVMYFLRG